MVVDQGKRVMSSDLKTGRRRDTGVVSRRTEEEARRSSWKEGEVELTREIVVCIPRVPFRPEAYERKASDPSAMRGNFSVLSGASRVKFFSRMGRAESSLRERVRRKAKGQRRKRRS